MRAWPSSPPESSFFFVPEPSPSTRCTYSSRRWSTEIKIQQTRRIKSRACLAGVPTRIVVTVIVMCIVSSRGEGGASLLTKVGSWVSSFCVGLICGGGEGFVHHANKSEEKRRRFETPEVQIHLHRKATMGHHLLITLCLGIAIISVSRSRVQRN